MSLGPQAAAAISEGSPATLLRIDLHCHSRFSFDGISTPEQMLIAAHRRGLDGFAITDHDTSEAVDYFGALGALDPEGVAVDGLLIIPGQEISTREGHLLALGVSLPNLRGISAQEAIEIVHAQGGIAVPAHPFDSFRAGIGGEVLDQLNGLDALETFNAAAMLRSSNAEAYEYARARRLPMTGGSDAHHPSPLGCAWTAVHTADFTVRGILAAIRAGRTEPQGAASGPRQRLDKARHWMGASLKIHARKASSWLART